MYFWSQIPNHPIRDLTNSPRKNTVLTTIPLKAKIATTIAFWLTQTTCATMSQIVCLAGILKMTGSLMTTPVSQGTFGLNDILKNKFLECFGSKLLSTLSKTVKSWTSQVWRSVPLSYMAKTDQRSCGDLLIFLVLMLKTAWKRHHHHGRFGGWREK